MALNIDTRKSGPTALKVSLAGSLDSQTAADLDAALNNALTDPILTVAFDLGGVEFISSAGLRVIFKTLKRLKTKGGRVCVSRLSDGVHDVFDIAKILPDLEVFSSEQEMEAYLAAVQKGVQQ